MLRGYDTIVRTETSKSDRKRGNHDVEKVVKRENSASGREELHKALFSLPWLVSPSI